MPGSVYGDKQICRIRARLFVFCFVNLRINTFIVTVRGEFFFPFFFSIAIQRIPRSVFSKFHFGFPSVTE